MAKILYFIFMLSFSIVVLGQKRKHTIGIHIGVGQFSESMLFPFVDNPSITNSTGLMILETAPSYSIGMHYERHKNKWLSYKLRISYIQNSYSYSTENNRFEYVESPFFDSFYSRQFNSLNYSHHLLTSEILFRLRFFKKQNFDGVVYFGPSIGHVVSNKFQHQPGEVFSTNPLIIDQLFGPENLNTFSLAFCINPQINFKLSRDWSFIVGFQTFFYFQPFLKYNEIWDRSDSAPLKENKSPRWGGLLQTGMQYHFL